jgi:hypothetical protein
MKSRSHGPIRTDVAAWRQCGRGGRRSAQRRLPNVSELVSVLAARRRASPQRPAGCPRGQHGGHLVAVRDLANGAHVVLVHLVDRGQHGPEAVRSGRPGSGSEPPGTRSRTPARRPCPRCRRSSPSRSAAPGRARGPERRRGGAMVPRRRRTRTERRRWTPDIDIRKPSVADCPRTPADATPTSDFVVRSPNAPRAWMPIGSSGTVTPRDRYRLPDVRDHRPDCEVGSETSARRHRRAHASVRCIAPARNPTLTECRPSRGCGVL